MRTTSCVLTVLFVLSLSATAASAQTKGDKVFVGGKQIGYVHAAFKDGYIVKVKRWYQFLAKKKRFYPASAVTIRRA
jgi:hypothetical protein